MTSLRERIRSAVRHAKRGQVIPLFAMAIVALLGMTSLAVDVGVWRYQQRVVQTAADSAALAGAVELIYSGTQAQITQYGRDDSSRNGFTDDGGATNTVTINNPPAAGRYAGNATAVEAIVTHRQPLFFARVVGLNGPTIPISARGVSRIDAAGSGSGCVYTLRDLLRINGGAGGFLAPNCGIVADEGMIINGNGTVTAPYIGVANGGVPNCGGCTDAHPTAALAAPDPCPAIRSCNYLLTHPPSVGAAPAPTTSGRVTTYYPGEYTSTLRASDDVVFSPGLYVFDQGMTASGNTTINATGVTIYNTGGAVTVSGSASMTLTPPTSGNWAGVSFFQPAANRNDATLNGQAGTDGIGGMIYAPGGDVTLDGNIPTVSELVVAGLTINGGGIRVNNTGAQGQELGIGHAVLAE